MACEEGLGEASSDARKLIATFQKHSKTADVRMYPGIAAVDQCRGLVRVKRVLNDHTLASDLDRQFGNVPVGLRKILLSMIHGFACTPQSVLLN
jgi:hypothetical protein